jgi:hypothetical protein
MDKLRKKIDQTRTKDIIELFKPGEANFLCKFYVTISRKKKQASTTVTGPLPPPQPLPCHEFTTKMTALTSSFDCHHCHPATATPHPTNAGSPSYSGTSIRPNRQKMRARPDRIRLATAATATAMPQKYYQNDRTDLLYPMTPLPPSHCHPLNH